MLSLQFEHSSGHSGESRDDFKRLAMCPIDATCDQGMRTGVVKIGRGSDGGHIVCKQKEKQLI